MNVFKRIRRALVGFELPPGLDGSFIVSKKTLETNYTIGQVLDILQGRAKRANTKVKIHVVIVDAEVHVTWYVPPTRQPIWYGGM